MVVALDARLTLHGGATGAPVGAARGRVSERAGVLVTLRDGHGRVGQGEASPLPGYSRETLDEVVEALRGALPRVEEDVVEAPLVGLGAPWLREIPGPARFALETAVLDLAGKRRGVSAHAILRGATARAGVAVSAYAGAALDAGLGENARDALRRGITTLKVKLLGAAPTFDDEVAALVELRRAFPNAWTLRLDLNGAWSVAEATAERFWALASVRPAFVEQPVPVGQLCVMGPCPVPWAIDESLVDEADTEYVMTRRAQGGCAAVIVKPAVHGLLGAWKLCERAHREGLGVVVTHLFDGPMALAAACELALALRAPWACGLDVHPGLASWPSVEVPQRADPRLITPSGRPGLGVEPLPD